LEHTDVFCIQVFDLDLCSYYAQQPSEYFVTNICSSKFVDIT